MEPLPYCASFASDCVSVKANSLIACMSSSGFQSAMRYERLQSADSGAVLGEVKSGELKSIDIVAARYNVR